MRKFTVAFSLVAALGLGACGEEPPQYVPPKKEQIDDPVAYFGLAPCTCYEYAPAAEWEEGERFFSRKLGVAVENIGGGIRLGRDYHRVRFRVRGQAVREEYLDPSTPQLLLAGVNKTGVVNDPIMKFDPPAVLIDAPPQAGQLLRTKVTTSFVSPTDVEEGQEVTVIAQVRNAEEVEYGAWDEFEKIFVPQTAEALPIAFAGVDGLRNDTRWFVPEKGFVKIRMEIEGEPTEWVLVNVRMLDAETCDHEGGPSEPVDLCGS